MGCNDQCHAKRPSDKVCTLCTLHREQQLSTAICCARISAFNLDRHVAEFAFLELLSGAIAPRVVYGSSNRTAPENHKFVK